MIRLFRRHVADRLIGEGRDPTSEETQHLEACPQCATAFRRRSAFDAQLRGATRDLVWVQLDAQILHAPQTAARPAGRSPLALVPIVIALFAAVVVFGPSRDASVGTASSPDPTAIPVHLRTLRIDCGALTQDECSEITGSEDGLPMRLWLLSDLGLLRGQVAASPDKWPVAVTFLSKSEVRVDWSDGTTTRDTVASLRTITITPGPEQ